MVSKIKLTKRKNFINKKINKIGVIYGILVGVIFGIIPIVTILNNTQIFEGLRLDANFAAQNAINSIARGASISAFNDLWTLILNGILLFALPGTYKNWQKVKELVKTKAGFFALIGGLFGGPLGNTFFFAVFILLTPSIGSVFFVLEMIFSGLIGFAIFKRNIGKKAWVGIGIIAISISIMLIAQTFATGGNSTNIIAGSILGILAVVSYSVEALLVDRAVTINKVTETTPFHFLQLKAISSSLFGLLILIPLTSAIFGGLFLDVFSQVSNQDTITFVENLGDVNNINASLGYIAFANLFTSISFPIAFTGSLLLFLGRVAFYNSISKIGATLTNTLFQLQIIVTPIVGGILYGIRNGLGLDFQFGGSTIYNIPIKNQVWFQPIFWILAFVTLLASFYVTFNKTPINRIKEQEIILNKKLLKKNINNT